MAINLIVIDCGHNYSDTNQKRSPIREDGTRFYEYLSNRKIGVMLAKELDKLGIKYVWTIKPDDKRDMTLKKRVEVANAYSRGNGIKNTLFLSLHSDALGNSSEWYESAVGYSIYTSKGTTTSDRYAKIFEEVAREILPKYGKKVRGCKEENFYVIKNTLSPAILLEQLFYTSHSDLSFLDSDEGREVLVRIIVEAIKRIMTLA